MKSITVKQLVNQYEEGTPSIIQAAFWYGQHIGAKRVCDKYKTLREAQIHRANSVRYHREALYVLGDVDYIYDTSCGDSEIGDWDFQV